MHIAIDNAILTRAIIQAGPVRKDRREVPVPDGAAQQPVPTAPLGPQIVYLPAPAPVYYGRGHTRSESSPDDRRYKRSRSPPLDLVTYPSVEDWLATLQFKDGAEKRDFSAMREKFQLHEYLEMDICDLSKIPHKGFGKDGFQFLLAESSFLLKWLEVTLTELRPPSHYNSRRGEEKRARIR